MLINDLYKVTFKCLKCNDVIKIDFNNLIEADAIVCPNCSLKLPDTALVHLSQGLEHFRTAVQTLHLNKEATKESEWTFALKIDYITNP